MPASGAENILYFPAVMGSSISIRELAYLIDIAKTVTVAAELSDGPVAVDWDQAAKSTRRAR